MEYFAKNILDLLKYHENDNVILVISNYLLNSNDYYEYIIKINTVLRWKLADGNIS